MDSLIHEKHALALPKSVQRRILFHVADLAAHLHDLQGLQIQVRAEMVYSTSLREKNVMQKMQHGVDTHDKGILHEDL